MAAVKRKPAKKKQAKPAAKGKKAKPAAKAKAKAKPAKAKAAKAKPAVKAKAKAKPAARAKAKPAAKAKPRKAPAAAPAPAASSEAAAESTESAESPGKLDKAAYAPGVLVEHPDNYSLIYSRFPSSEDVVAVFDERGLQGGGYTWHGLVVHLLNEQSPATLDAIEFDPEGDMFCAVSTDLDALRTVGSMLAQLENVELLKKLAATVDLSEYD